MRVAVRIVCVVVVIAGWMVVAGAPPAAACTSAVVGPEASVTGTPLLWKNRDTPVLANKVVYIDERPFAYLCLANAEADSGRSCWAGLNSTGFAIMNTATYNVPTLEGEEHSRQGIIMADALRSCRTVADFEHYLEANLGPEFGGKANFGVMDADGGAALFEVHNHDILRMDAADEPADYLVNTNFARSGTEGKGHGYLRFERAVELFAAFPPGGVDPETILHRFSRDFDNPLIDEPLLADAAAFPVGEPVWINSRDCIDRPLTASTVVLVGRSADRPATMWVIPGEPVTAAAIPLWVEAGRSPRAMYEGDRAPLWQESRRIKNGVRPSSEGHTADYIDLARLDNPEGTGYLPGLLEMEASIFSETEAFLAGGPTPGELAGFQEEVANRVLAHLRSVVVPGVEPPSPEGDGKAPTASCDELVARLEQLALESAVVEFKTIGQTREGEAIRVIEFSDRDGEDGPGEKPLTILISCDERADGLSGGQAPLELARDPDLVLVPRTEETP